MAGVDEAAATPPSKMVPADSSNGIGYKRRKKTHTGEGSGHSYETTAAEHCESNWRSPETGLMIVDQSDRISVNNLAKELDSGKYGSVTKYMWELLVVKKRTLDARNARDLVLPYECSAVQNKKTRKAIGLSPTNVINLEDDNDDNVGGGPAVKQFVPSVQQLSSASPVFIDLDDEDDTSESLCHHQDFEVKNHSDNLLTEDFAEWGYVEMRSTRSRGNACVAGENELVSNRLKGDDYVEIQTSRKDAHLAGENEESNNYRQEQDYDCAQSPSADAYLAAESELVKNNLQGLDNVAAQISNGNGYIPDDSELINSHLLDLDCVETQSSGADGCPAGETEFINNDLQELDYIEAQSSRGDGYSASKREQINNQLKERDYGDGYLAAESKPIKNHLQETDVGTQNSIGDTFADESELIKNQSQDFIQTQSSGDIASENGLIDDRGLHVGIEDDFVFKEEDRQLDPYDDCLSGIWNEMAFALECSKDPTVDPLPDVNKDKRVEDCDHFFIMKDDIGEVCRICGIVERSIESIIEYNFLKGAKSTRTYSRYDGHTTKDLDQTGLLPDELKSMDTDISIAQMYPHPLHKREMKPHQVEGFNFLVSNLVTDNPGGCIMAHAPGSGKTFMIISFLQSFMAKNDARPLIVLPRGILATWKKEFDRWQVEGWPLYDLYSVKADSRTQQLQVLRDWEKERSILFLGYKQFSSIICDSRTGKAALSCQEILLKCPTILILDEGHTPRNQDTDILTSLEKVQTRRKVVLSGTLYQNHVEEVFNVLNLVRPRFLKLETSKEIMRRVSARAKIRGRNLSKKVSAKDFYDVIEHTLLKDDNHTRKVSVIQDLREMTRKVLHYYKGDNLDELPGLVDFSVFLQLSPLQVYEVTELRKLCRKFKINSEGSAIYVHPRLKNFSKSPGAKDGVDEERIDLLVKKLDVSEGVKAKFCLNLLQLCESCGEKLLVFSQYLLPLKFLERLTAKVKGYSIGKEMFIITGDSNSETRETYMERFNSSFDARVLFGSIKACGEGISLVGASRVIILDIHLNPSVTRQAIGRAFRPGQMKRVFVYRLVASDSPEVDDHMTCLKKESIAKLWFEWDEFIGRKNFETGSVDVNDCGDPFLETDQMKVDVIDVFKR